MVNRVEGLGLRLAEPEERMEELNIRMMNMINGDYLLIEEEVCHFCIKIA